MLSTNGMNSYLLKALNDHGVEYLVAGGLAVRYYIPEREVDDLDLLINPTSENVRKFKDAIYRLAADGMCFGDPGTVKWEKLLRPYVCFPLKRNLYADILTPPDGFDFSNAFRNSIKVNVNEIPSRVMSCDDLIVHKQLSNREQDNGDVECLRKVCNDRTHPKSIS